MRLVQHPAGLMLVLATACGAGTIETAKPAERLGILELTGPRFLAASPDGVLWIGDRGPHIYRSVDWNQTWDEVGLPVRLTDADGEAGDRLDALWFFDRDHALLAGDFGNGNKTRILRTSTAGMSWELQELPAKGPVEAAELGTAGSGWLAVGKMLLRTRDFGASWTAAAGPHSTKGIFSFDLDESGSGLVGMFENELWATEDGGAQWSRVPTPADELCPPDPKDPADSEPETRLGSDGKSHWTAYQSLESRVCVLRSNDGQQFVQQEGQIFQRAQVAGAPWVLLDLDIQSLWPSPAPATGYVAQTRDDRLVRLDASFQRLGSPSDPIPGRSVVADSPRGIAALVHWSGTVCTWNDGPIACSALHTTDTKVTPRLRDFDRTSDGTLWAVSSKALYRSGDAGRTWEIRAEGSQLASVRVRPDGAGVLLHGESGWSEWSVQDGLNQPHPLIAALPASAEIDARHGSLWIATGFDAAQDEETQRRLRSSDTILAGDGFTAFAFASADSGRTWIEIDRYRGATIDASWLGADNVLSLSMSDGALRRMRLERDTAARIGPVESPERVSMGGQWACWLAFPEPAIGVAGGMHYFGPGVAQRSDDGGQSWQRDSVEDEHVIKTFLLGGGTCARVVGFWDERSRVEVWRAGHFETVGRLEFGAHDARVDSAGCLLVRLVNGDVWSLDALGESLTKAAQVPVPAR